jgi:hypothetical protein
MPVHVHRHRDGRMPHALLHDLGRQAEPSASTPKFCVDLYDTGSCTMSLDAQGDIMEILACARNAIVARAAFDELCRREPSYSLEQRRRSWVEEARILEPLGLRLDLAADWGDFGVSILGRA